VALGNATTRPDGSVMVSVVVGRSEAGYFIGCIDAAFEQFAGADGVRGIPDALTSYTALR
jgi:hypothetical protein